MTCRQAERKAMDFRLTSAATATVYNAIGVGKENATSRRELCRVTGLPDRAVRKAIEILRYDRPILTADNGLGYYIPRTDAQGRREAVRWIETQDRRCRSIKTAERGAKRFARNMKPPDKEKYEQLSLFGGCCDG
nr:MAG TPA: GTP-sensing transcriptional pleiotropic repressor CodY, wHTH, transcriptional regulator, CodY [Caudoviricetes sp.]